MTDLQPFACESCGATYNSPAAALSCEIADDER